MFSNFNDFKTRNMKAEEYLKENCKLDDWDSLEENLKDSIWTNNVITYMEDYHKSKLKLLNIASVSQQRELFFVFVKFMNEFYLNRELDEELLWDDFKTKNCG